MKVYHLSNNFLLSTSLALAIPVFLFHSHDNLLFSTSDNKVVTNISSKMEASLNITSTAFSANENIPSKYSCEGENINPPLTIKNIPGNAVTLALIVDDPDAPKGTFVHWVAYNIPAVQDISENSKPGVQGKNGAGKTGYTGPCPPSGTHHYHFKVYALDSKLDLKEGAEKADLESAIKGHIVGKGELIGLYKKAK